jgi:hypothetical protein
MRTVLFRLVIFACHFRSCFIAACRMFPRHDRLYDSCTGDALAELRKLRRVARLNSVERSASSSHGRAKLLQVFARAEKRPKCRTSKHLAYSPSLSVTLPVCERLGTKQPVMVSSKVQCKPHATTRNTLAPGNALRTSLLRTCFDLDELGRRPTFRSGSEMPEEASYRLQPSQMNCSEMAAFRARTILRVPTSDCSF